MSDPARGYGDALAALQRRGRFGIRLGLGRTRALLRALGDPQRSLRGVLIGGTNGKGSVQAIVAASLHEAGYRVGQTPKPHLVSYRERIVVDGEPIHPAAFGELLHEVLGIADRITGRLGPPTEFEVVTAAAFAWFARAGIDVAVVEVGLGGRLDATNAWDGGVAAITNVDWDHMDRLGPTLREIGREKAAIIKRGDLAVTGAAGEGLAVIRRRARRLGIRLDEAAPLAVMGMDRGGMELRDERLGVLRLGLLGRHQAANAAVALRVLEALRLAGIADVPDDALRRALREVRWPGRLELLAVDGTGRGVPAAASAPDPDAPDLLLDGAHNPAGTRALADAFRELRGSLSPGPPTVLLGMLADKPVDAMLDGLLPAFAADAQLIATTVPDTPRSLPATDLVDAWRRRSAAAGPDSGPSRAAPSAEAIVDPDAALDAALARARGEGGPIVVAGSLYLVGHIRGRLVHDPALVDPAH